MILLYRLYPLLSSSPAPVSLPGPAAEQLSFSLSDCFLKFRKPYPVPLFLAFPLSSLRLHLHRMSCKALIQTRLPARPPHASWPPGLPVPQSRKLHSRILCSCLRSRDPLLSGRLHSLLRLFVFHLQIRHLRHFLSPALFLPVEAVSSAPLIETRISSIDSFGS